MKLLPRCAALLLLCGIGTAFAQAPAPADATPRADKRVEWCQKNPERCAELKARREAKCAENPQKCAEQKQRAEERRAQCAADPEKCKAERQEKKEQHRKRLEDACMDKPDGKACARLQKLDQLKDAATATP